MASLPARGAKISAWTFTDVSGKRHDPFAEKSVRAFVVVFVVTDCPIANYYQPTLRRLAKRYESKGVRFILAYPDPDITAGKVKKHVEAFDIRSPVVMDSAFALARR